MSIRRRNDSPVSHRFHFSGGRQTAPWRLAGTLAVAAATLTPAGVLLGAPSASATVRRPALRQSIFANSAPVDNRVGDSIDYDVEIFLASDDCPISDGTVSLVLPDMTKQILANGTLSLDPGMSTDFAEETLG